MLVLLALSVLASVVLSPGWIRTLVVFVAALFVPGAALLTRARLLSLLHGAALAIGVSLATEGAMALLLVQVRWWHPSVVAVLAAVGCGVLLVTDIRRRRALTEAPDPTAWGSPRRLGDVIGQFVRPSVIVLLTGLVLWGVSLPHAGSAPINANGLLNTLPATWYIALGLVVLSATGEIWSQDMSPVVAALCIASVALILYATIPILEHSPQYSYTYKHIGVTRLIMASGRVFPNVDIYNRWPVFFATAAAFFKIVGSDPLLYAKWFEPAFAVLDAVIVAAIARYLSGSTRIAAMSALIWLGVDWVGQGYYSPQAFAYTIGLVVMLILTISISMEGVAERVLRRLGARVLRRAQPTRALSVSSPWAPVASALVAVALTAVTAAAHQLTPYLLVLEVAVLVLFGLRPWWIPAAMLGVAVAYLIPNFTFVNSHWGVLSGLDPLANAVVTPGATVIRPWLYSNDGRLITVIAMLIAGGSALAIARGGRIGVAGLLSTLMIVPFFLVAVSSYGGEGILRSALFSSPWVAVLVAWGIYLLPTGARLPAGSVVALGLIGLVTIGIMANASFNVIPPSEVTASEYFYAHAPAGSILVQIGGDFPSEVGVRYADMADPATEGSPTLFDYGWADSPRFGARSLEDLIVSINELSLTPFVVFSTSDERLVDDEHLARPGAVTALEHAVARSSVFRLWYANKDTRIYELVA